MCANLNGNDMSIKEKIDKAGSVEEISKIITYGVVDYTTFCDRLDECRQDGVLKFNESTNTNTEMFLEAMTGFLRDTDGGERFFENRQDCYITWADLLNLIFSANIYD